MAVDRSDRVDFDAPWDYGRPAETEQRLRQLLPEAATDRAYHAELLTQIARAQGLQRQFAAAHQTLDEVEMLLDDAMTVPRIRYLLERGRVYNSSQRPDVARPCFWGLGSWPESEVRIARWCVARTLRSLGRLEEASSFAGRV